MKKGYKEITVKEAVETIQNLNRITGKEYFFKANKGGISLECEDSIDIKIPKPIYVESGKIPKRITKYLESLK